MNNYENNKLIAKYLGFKLVEHSTLNGKFQWVNSDPLKFPPLNNLLDFEKNLMFDTNPNWLMPVVELIINSKDIPNKGDYHQVFLSRISSISVRNSLSESKFFYMSNNKGLMNGIYDVVVSYIKWLNEQNINNE